MCIRDSALAALAGPADGHYTGRSCQAAGTAGHWPASAGALPRRCLPSSLAAAPATASGAARLMFSYTGCGGQAADTEFHRPAVAGTLPRCRSPPCWRTRRLLDAAHM
eukprot:14766810-Alexandrium_andersonii.AAC.1